MYWKLIDAECRAGALKTDWTEPPEDGRPMGIECHAELRGMGKRPVVGGWIAVGSG